MLEFDEFKLHVFLNIYLQFVELEWSIPLAKNWYREKESSQLIHVRLTMIACR